MLMLRDLSLRYKIPLRVVGLVLVTAVVVTGSMIARETEELRQALLAGGERLGRVLAETLVAPLTHDDVWRAYEIIQTPLRGSRDAAPELAAEWILVLDSQQRVFASTEPHRYPIHTTPAHRNDELRRVGEATTARGAEAPFSVEIAGSERIYIVASVVSDSVRLGTVVMSYSRAAFLPRYLDLAQRGALMTLLVLAVLVPLSWYWGKLTARPLLQLSDAMDRVGARLPEEHEVTLPDTGDEIGRLGQSFRRMLAELREKAKWEQEAIASNRLAAIGQLTAGIAHEINNPLGGMLNALNTFRRHGSGDPVAAKTATLLERGLSQIRETVSALLVEARPESHPLTPDDVDDAYTLVLPALHRKRAHIEWDNQLAGPIALPSALVRQILLNLLLNAVAAASEAVRCDVCVVADALRIRVMNDGRHIAAERLPYLFEPFSQASESGHGLGLWMTYQIVEQLGGRIVVASEPGRTEFTVELPLEATDEPIAQALPD